MPDALYDSIGRSYRSQRTPDLRIAAIIDAAVGDAARIVNVGAGSGSYERADRVVCAVEPSRVMVEQRPPDSAPAVRGSAEALPLPDQSFDVATAFLTLHHWSDVERGLAELQRVASRVVLLTWIGFPNGFWLLDYFPEIEAYDRPRFPTESQLDAMLGGVESTVVPIPHDCTDGFLCAYWRRPEFYLDEQVRSGISTIQRIGNLDEGLTRLRNDLESGAWQARNASLLDRESMDYGYRVIATKP